VGKTALSINLAFAFQQSGKRTPRVDLDRRERRDSTYEKFKAEDDDLGEGRLTSNICESDYPGLNILPSNCLWPLPEFDPFGYWQGCHARHGACC
jgi:cellulose biosynthesis protein BcsQ